MVWVGLVGLFENRGVTSAVGCGWVGVVVVGGVSEILVSDIIDIAQRDGAKLRPRNPPVDAAKSGACNGVTD